MNESLPRTGRPVRPHADRRPTKHPHLAAERLIHRAIAGLAGSDEIPDDVRDHIAAARVDITWP